PPRSSSPRSTISTAANGGLDAWRRRERVEKAALSRGFRGLGVLGLWGFRVSPNEFGRTGTQLFIGDNTDWPAGRARGKFPRCRKTNLSRFIVPPPGAPSLFPPFHSRVATRRSHSSPTR